jgi:hypothetical protein
MALILFLTKIAMAMAERRTKMTMAMAKRRAKIPR